MPQREALARARVVPEEDPAFGADRVTELSEALIATHRSIQVQDALLHQTERDHSCNRLGDRGDVERRLGRDGNVALEVGEAESASQKHGCIAEDDHREPGDVQRLPE